MSEEAATAAPAALEKSAEDTARLRSFTMGIGKFCHEAGIEYDDLAKAAGVAPDDLAPGLVEVMLQSAQAKGQ